MLDFGVQPPEPETPCTLFCLSLTTDVDGRIWAKPPSPPPDGARRRSRTDRRHDRPPRFGAGRASTIPGLGLARPSRRDPPAGCGRRPGDRPLAPRGTDRRGPLAPRSYAGADRSRHIVRCRPARVHALPVVLRARYGAARGDRTGDGAFRAGRRGIFAADRRGPRGPRLARSGRRAAADSRRTRLILAASRGDRPALP